MEAAMMEHHMEAAMMEHHMEAAMMEHHMEAAMMEHHMEAAMMEHHMEAAMMEHHMEAAMMLIVWCHMGSTWVQHHFWEPIWRHRAAPGWVSGICWLVKIQSMAASMKLFITRKLWHLDIVYVREIY